MKKRLRGMPPSFRLYAKDDESDGRWVTIGGDDVKHRGGTPVFITSSGDIAKGPKSLVGQNVAKIGGGDGGRDGEGTGPGASAIDDIKRLIGANGSDLDDVQAPGVWWRVQPAGLGLDHRSETSNGTAAGLHVFATLAQAILQEGRWAMRRRGYELVVIRGPLDLPDSHDVEGWELPLGNGQVIGRYDYDKICDEADEEDDD